MFHVSPDLKNPIAKLSFSVYGKAIDGFCSGLTGYRVCTLSSLLSPLLLYYKAASDLLLEMHYLSSQYSTLCHEDRWVDLNLKFCKMSKKINKSNFPSVYSVFNERKAYLTHITSTLYVTNEYNISIYENVLLKEICFYRPKPPGS